MTQRMTKSNMKNMMPLKEAMVKAPNSSGCYKIYCKDELVYIGKASDGIRKRIVQYYNGTTAHYPSAQKIYENRDKIKVKWLIADKSECAALESYWISKYKPAWNAQSGWSNEKIVNQQLNMLKKKYVNRNSTNSLKTTSSTNRNIDVNSGKSKQYVTKANMDNKTFTIDLKSAAKSSAKSGAITTAIIETGKGILNGDDMGTCTNNVVRKSAESAVSGAIAGCGACTGGMLMGLVNPALYVPGMILGGVFAGEVASDAVDGVFDPLGDIAEEVVETVGGAVISVAEGAKNFIEDAFSGLFSLFI